MDRKQINKPTSDVQTSDKSSLIKMLKKAHIGYSIYHGIGGASSIEADGVGSGEFINFDFDRDGNLLKLYL